MIFKNEKTMKIKLNNTDVLEIAKALKSGWLDMDKISAFKSLIDGYNPPKKITDRQLNYMVSCLYKGIGYKPNSEAATKELCKELPTELQEKWKVGIENGQLYRMFIKEAFMGMIAVKAIGGQFTLKEPDFSFAEKAPDFLSF